MWRLIQQGYLSDAGRGAARHVRQRIDGADRKTFLDKLRQVLARGAEGDRIGAVHDSVRHLPAVAADHRLLIDIELLDEILAELDVKTRGVIAAGARYAGIMCDDLALPFRIEQIVSR